MAGEIQAPIGETEAVYDHRFQSLANCDVALAGVLGDELIDGVPDFEFGMSA